MFRRAGVASEAVVAASLLSAVMASAWSDNDGHMPTFPMPIM